MGKECGHGNPFVAIPAVIGGIILVCAILFMVLSPENIGTLHSIIWGLVALGFFALVFAYSAEKKKK